LSLKSPILTHSQPLKGDARPRLYWCPTGIFTRLPLHAAGIYDGNQLICCSDYVVSTYTSTLTSLLRAQRSAVPLPRNKARLTVVAEKQAQDPEFNVIPQVDIELEEVIAASRSRLVPIAHRLDGSTTIKSVSNAIETGSIVHLACHGVQDTGDASRSGFCLGDGRLTISDIMELKMGNPFLAFLSACETAKGDADQPDQVMHLAAAMLFCGFKSVVATMWYVICREASLNTNHIDGQGDQRLGRTKNRQVVLRGTFRQ
jgi:CHAT domain-containing protein